MILVKQRGICSWRGSLPPPALSGTIPFFVSWVNTSTRALCMAPLGGLWSTETDFTYFGGNLVNDPAASLNDHLGGKHPLDCVTKLHTRLVHSSGVSWYFQKCFSRAYQSCQWKGKLAEEKQNFTLWQHFSFTTHSFNWELENVKWFWSKVIHYIQRELSFKGFKK